LKSSSKLNMPTRFIPELLGRQICLASDLCTTAPYPNSVTADFRRASRDRAFAVWRDISKTGATA
jgi:hypothetical protein